MRDNNVYGVMVVSNETPLLVKDKTLEDLGVNQIGFFDVNTGKSFDATAIPDKIQIVLGLDSNNDNFKDDVIFNPGSVIPLMGFTDNYKSYAANAVPMIVKISGYAGIHADTEYQVKINFINQTYDQLLGNNLNTVTYSYKTSCCEDGCDCTNGNCNELSKGLRDVINADPYSLVTAVITAAEDLDSIPGLVLNSSYAAGDEILDEDDIQTLIDWNNDPANEAAKVCTDLKLTTNFLPMKNYCAINLGYTKFRGTSIEVYPVNEFKCSATVTVLQEMKFPVGSGYDIRELEYFEGGWNGNPGVYRASDVGVTLGEFKYLADSSKKYDIITLKWLESIPGDASDYTNDFLLYIAIEDSLEDTTIETLINAILAKSGKKLIGD